MERGRKPAESCAPWGQLVTAFGWSNLKNFSQRRSRSEVCRVNYLGLRSKHLHLSVSVSGKQLPWKQLSPVRSGIVLRLSSNSWLLTHQIISKEAKLRVYSSNLQHKRVKVSLSMVIFEISVIISKWLWQCLTDFVKKNDRIIFLCQHTRSNKYIQCTGTVVLFPFVKFAKTFYAQEDCRLITLKWGHRALTHKIKDKAVAS